MISRKCPVFMLIAIFSMVSGFIVGPNHWAEAITAENGLAYASWSEALSKYVAANGNVDYKKWKGDQGQLNAFIKSLSSMEQNQYTSMNRADRLALWINAYNAYTVKLVLDHYPLRKSGLNFYPANSIRQINGVWDKFKLQVAGREVSLSEIENRILRVEFKEPLIHFAINCASKSCPKLSNKPYRGETIQAQLEASARNFISDPSKNKFDPARKRVSISSIFRWYRSDFISLLPSREILPGRTLEDTAIVKFLEQYSIGKHRDWLASNEFKLDYLPYDWSLNERNK